MPTATTILPPEPSSAVDLGAIAFWTAPELTSLHRLPMASPLVSHADPDSARHGGPSPWLLPLDGTWRFHLADRPEDAPREFADPAFDDAAWREVDVPGLWTMQDTTDRPQYTNVVMPFDQKAPVVPDANPTGCYRRRFSIPREWTGRRIVLQIGGAESALAVAVNGRLAGLSKDSHLAAEFDVTHLVEAGDNNVVALLVVKWSDASHLEDQDQWWHGGISRSVLLRATAPVHIADVKAIGGLTDDGDGSLDLRVEVGTGLDGIGSGWRVEAMLEALDGYPVETGRQLSGEVPRAGGFGFTGHVVRTATTAVGIVPWSAETPQRYRLLITLVSPAGDPVESVAVLVGFRSVRIRDRQLLINGEPVLIRGVNRHDFHPDTGRVLARHDLEADVVAIKRAGFNAVRTAHYPNDPAFLDLCDEHGLYVVDEADIETHAAMFTLCNDPRYTAAWVDRGARMVRRDKNHPCVILWSLGNESGHGANHEAMAAWIRRYDPSRPLHYEGAVMLGLERGASVTDVVCPMYPSIERIVEWATSGDQRPDDDRPLIMCEYSHAMGNSNGSLADYWAAIEEHHGLQGGFIWEWWDHGLRQPIDDAPGWRYAYGGDFGEQRHDGNFCLDGVVWPDRTPKPAIEEHRQLATPIRLAWAEPGRRLRVENQQWFRGLGDFEAIVDVLVDGRLVTTHPLALPEVAARSSVEIDLPAGLPGDADSLLVHLLLGADTSWAPAGFEVAFQQLDCTARPTTPGAGVAGTGDADPVELADPAAPVTWPFDFVSLPTLSLWRAPVDNDRVHAGLPVAATPAARWVELGLDRLVPVDVMETEEDGVRTITATYPHGVHHVIRIRGLRGGGVAVEEEAVIPEALDDLARVGSVLTVAAGYDRLEWFGRGPVETYPDRKLGAPEQRWTSTVAEEYVPYIKPQEHGGHEDVRSVSFTDVAGRGVALRFGHPMHVSASHYTAADLASVDHDVDLRPRSTTTIHLDAAHRGLGTASCGPDTLARYLVGAGTYRWSWLAEPTA